MQVSVVIPFTPDSHQISRLLKNLELQQGVEFEVLGVFNPHTRSLPQIPALKYPYLQLSSPKGANCARNTGLRRAKSDIIVFLDADCLPTHSQFLLNYFKEMEANPQLTGIGGYYRLETNESLESQAYHYLQTRWLQEGLLNSKGDCRNLLGGNLVLRKSKLLGQEFDENLIFGGTEREFLQRLQSRGRRFKLVSGQEVWHSVNLDYFGLLKKAYAQGKGARYILDKWGEEKKSVVNLRVDSPNEQLFRPLHLYKLFFELGFQRGSFYHFRKTWKDSLQLFIETFSIAQNAQSIKERRES